MKKIVVGILVVISFAGLAQQKPVQKKTSPKKNAPLKYWEEFSEKEKASVLNDSSVSKNMMDLYNGKYYFGGGNGDEVLYKELTSTSGSLVALRVFLFSKLISAGDTSQKKYLQEYAVKMMYNQPDVLMRYFAKERAKKNELYKRYIPYFAGDLDERVEFANFKDFLDLYFVNSSAENKQMLALMLKECEKAGAGKNDPVPVPLPPKGKDD